MPSKEGQKLAVILRAMADLVSPECPCEKSTTDSDPCQLGPRLPYPPESGVEVVLCETEAYLDYVLAIVACNGDHTCCAGLYEAYVTRRNGCQTS